MRYTKINFHHAPGHECVHLHSRGYGDAHAHTDDKTIQLLEYLCHHNEEHAQELAGYRDEVDDAGARGLLDESILLLGESNGKLAEAIAVLKRGD